jgi:hypothetical protein
MSTLQQNCRKGQNRFCLKVRGVGKRGMGRRARGSNDPNNVCTCEYMNKEKKVDWVKTIVDYYIYQNFEFNIVSMSIVGVPKSL